MHDSESAISLEPLFSLSPSCTEETSAGLMDGCKELIRAITMTEVNELSR